MDTTISNLGAVATIASGVASTVIAIVALVFAYRQNVGWKPVILAHKARLSGESVNSGPPNFRLSFTVEFWNRCKYPVVVRGLSATVSGVEVIDFTDGDEGRTYVKRNEFNTDLEIVVPPLDRANVEIAVSLKRQSLDAMQPGFAVRLLFFDPYRKRDQQLDLTYRFFYPSLGWNKSEEERRLAEIAYNKPYSEVADVEGIR